MSKSFIEQRKDKYIVLKDKLSLLTNDEIKNMIRYKKTDRLKKWGIYKVVSYNFINIFVKALPIAELFADKNNYLTSSNLYNLPAYYNYGYGSAGINCWRELLLHIKTTNYVLNDMCHNFPILYYYRIIEDDNNYFVTGLDDQLVERWDNNSNIIKYLNDRANAKYKIVLFLEYIPYNASEYIQKNNNFIKQYYKEMRNIIKFINNNGILHNDAHIGNYLIDNKQNVYITDFGTSLDKEFDLSEDEKKFMDMNSKLDRIYIYYNIISLYIYSCIYNPKIEQKYNLKAFSNSSVLPETLKLTKYLIKNIDLINEDLKMSKFQYKLIKKYRKIIIRYIRWKTKFKTSKEIDKNNYYLDSL